MNEKTYKTNESIFLDKISNCLIKINYYDGLDFVGLDGILMRYSKNNTVSSWYGEWGFLDFDKKEPIERDILQKFMSKMLWKHLKMKADFSFRFMPIPNSQLMYFEYVYAN